jgi:signal transduction histidine kinase
MSLVAHDIESAGIQITTDLPRKTRPVLVDPRALQQVMLNLMTNATQALEGRNDPRIVVRARNFDGLTRIEVQDNGCGISEREQKNLFKPFYTSKPSGTGLGLVITKKMLAKMNSTIEIVSREGFGTTVIMALPESSHENS